MTDVKYTPQELVEVYFVASGGIADLDAPEVGELNAGTRITQFLQDGPPAPAGSNFVNSGTLDSGFEEQVASTYGGGSGTMTTVAKRDDTTTDDSADTIIGLLPRGTVGYLVEAPYGVDGASNAFAVGDDVTIKPIEVANDPGAARVISRGNLVTIPVDLAFNGLPHVNVAVVADT